mgnify:CR=1 FL=1
MREIEVPAERVSISREDKEMLLQAVRRRRGGKENAGCLS